MDPNQSVADDSGPSLKDPELVSKLVEDVRPVFILVDHNLKNSKPLLAEHELTSFRPIDQKIVKIHHGAISFEVPRQSNEVVSQIKNLGKQLRLALYRSSDDVFSKNTFDFDYHQQIVHMFCQR